MFNFVLKFFDRAEDVFRRYLSRRPIPYAFIAGVGVILFWRGVWHFNDFLVEYYSKQSSVNFGIDAVGLPWWDGPLSFLIGALILLMTGPFVSSFLGNELIISGLRGEKKLAEKTEDEVESEKEKIDKMQKDLAEIKNLLVK
jgi:hypothetical protein